MRNMALPHLTRITNSLELSPETCAIHGMEGESQDEEQQEGLVAEDFTLPYSLPVVVSLASDVSFPAEVAYATPEGLLYWDLQYVWEKVNQAGCGGDVKRMIQVISKLAAADLGPGHCHIRSVEMMKKQSALQANCCTSKAMMKYYAWALENARLPTVINFVSEVVKHIVLKALSICHRAQGVAIKAFVVNAAGIVENFAEVLGQQHHSVKKAIQGQWDSMVGDILSGNFGAQVGLVDFVLFALRVSKVRKIQQKNPWKLHVGSFISELLLDVVEFLANVHYQICCEYMGDNPGCQQEQIPSRRMRGRETAPASNVRANQEDDDGNGNDEGSNNGGEQDGQEPRSRKKLHVNQIWNFLESKKPTMSLEALADARLSEKHGGATKSTVAHWAKKKLNLYFSRSVSMFENLSRVRVVTDDSTHSTQETMVTVFGTEAETACFATIQRIPSLKFVTPFEFDFLEESAERLCARREQVRLASYRFLTALDYQLDLVSSGSLSLEKFRAPSEAGLDPLVPGDVRFQRVISDKCWVQVKRHGDDVGKLVKLNYDQELPIMVLLSDQGPVCTAASAFVKYDSYSTLVHYQWDGIHRVVNDLKNSMTSEMSQAVLKSRYLFGLNYRPFGSGAFFAEKCEILRAFMEMESWALWLKLIII